MPFKKGRSGNINGRPPGSEGERNKVLKGLITDLIMKRWGKIEKRLDQCDAKDELYFLSKMMDLVVRKPAQEEPGSDVKTIPFSGVLEQKYKDAGAA